MPEPPAPLLDPSARGTGDAGADLRGLDLAWASLAGRDLRGACLNRADLRGADLAEVRLDHGQAHGARLRGASLARASAPGLAARDVDLEGASLRDAHLPGADLKGAVLFEADLRHADLARANLEGADLRRADLRSATLDGAFLAGADLRTADLRGASLRGADLTGVRWSPRSTTGPTIGDDLGLSPDDLAALTAAGAIGGEPSRRRRRRAPWLALAALALGAVLVARQLGDAPAAPEPVDDVQALRTIDPATAAEHFERAAAGARSSSDRVGWLLEAASLRSAAGQPETTSLRFEDALAAAHDQPALAIQVRLAHGRWLEDRGRVVEAARIVTPILQEDGASLAQRARAIVAMENAGGSTDNPPSAAVADLHQSLSALPRRAAEQHLAVAEERANRAERVLALAQVDRAESLDPSQAGRMRAAAVRARVLDRLGRSDEAEWAWHTLLLAAPPDSEAGRSSRLALADLHLRSGDDGRALALLEPLLDNLVEPAVRSRAWLLAGQGHEQQAEALAAADAYRRSVAASEEGGVVLADTADLARKALSRTLWNSGGPTATLPGLSPTDMAAVQAEARIGEARRQLDSGDAAAALALGDAVAAQVTLTPSTLRAARVLRGEALAATGRPDEAMATWRTMLDEGEDPLEQQETDVLVARGLLQNGERAEAQAAFQELAASTRSEFRARGLLGLADLARSKGEVERAAAIYQQVADSAADRSATLVALEELAGLREEDGQAVRADEARRALLGAAAPGDAAVARTRVALVLSARAAGRLEDALRECKDAVRTATGDERSAARLTCAEVAEHAGRVDAARNEYVALQEESESVPAHLRADAALALARLAVSAGDRDGARAAWRTATALAGDDRRVSFTVALGEAEIQLGEGQPRQALTLLEALEPPDEGSRRGWLHAVATARTAAGDPRAREAWQAVATAAGEDRSAAAEALRQQAALVLADDQPAAAAALYRRAAQVAVDPVDRAWARLGAAESLAAAGDDAEARSLLVTLASEEDPEVGLQAAVLQSRLAASAGDWVGALAVLDGRDGAPHGPAWDATLVETRVAALIGADRDAEAERQLAALADRWPTEEEAQLPAWLGLARLAAQRGDAAAARKWARRARASAVDPGYQTQADDLLARLGPPD